MALVDTQAFYAKIKKSVQNQQHTDNPEKEHFSLNKKDSQKIETAAFSPQMESFLCLDDALKTRFLSWLKTKTPEELTRFLDDEKNNLVEKDKWLTYFSATSYQTWLFSQLTLKHNGTKTVNLSSLENHLTETTALRFKPFIKLGEIGGSYFMALLQAFRAEVLERWLPYDLKINQTTFRLDKRLLPFTDEKSFEKVVYYLMLDKCVADLDTSISLSFLEDSDLTVTGFSLSKQAAIQQARAYQMELFQSDLDAETCLKTFREKNDDTLDVFLVLCLYYLHANKAEKVSLQTLEAQTIDWEKMVQLSEKPASNEEQDSVITKEIQQLALSIQALAKQVDTLKVDASSSDHTIVPTLTNIRQELMKQTATITKVEQKMVELAVNEPVESEVTLSDDFLNKLSQSVTDNIGSVFTNKMSDYSDVLVNKLNPTKDKDLLLTMDERLRSIEQQTVVQSNKLDKMREWLAKIDGHQMTSEDLKAFISHDLIQAIDFGPKLEQYLQPLYQEVTSQNTYNQTIHQQLQVFDSELKATMQSMVNDLQSALMTSKEEKDLELMQHYELLLAQYKSLQNELLDWNDYQLFVYSFVFAVLSEQNKQSVAQLFTDRETVVQAFMTLSEKRETLRSVESESEG